jgi:hypothetical protein
VIEYPSSYGFAVSKFVCGLLLHWLCQSRIRQGLDGMKFALNHSHRFDKPKFAFFISFSLLVIMLTIEVVNFLMILQTNDLNNLIQNVTALVIIAEADVLLYTTLKDEVLKDVLTISTF